MGEFTPGDKLGETDLSERFEISRPPLREAFRVLERDGLVLSIPRKGIYVRELSVKEITDIYNFRYLIELNALKNLEQKNIRELSVISKTIITSFSSPEDIYEYQKLSLNFHINLVETLDNTYISRCIQTLMYNLSRYVFISFSDPEMAKKSLNEHEKIIESIKKGDYQLSKLQLEKHLTTSCERVAGIVSDILKNK
jgi:DNA-binding GntR family transcriptional regulator